MKQKKILCFITQIINYNIYSINETKNFKIK